MLSKRCQLHFLSGQGKSTSQTTSGVELPSLPLKKKSITFALRKEAEKTHKTEGTNSLIACTQRLGNQKRFLTDPNFDLAFTRRRTCPATPCGGLCHSRKRLHRARRQPKGAAADTNQEEGSASAKQPLASFEVTFTQRLVIL